MDEVDEQNAFPSMPRSFRYFRTSKLKSPDSLSTVRIAVVLTVSVRRSKDESIAKYLH